MQRILLFVPFEDRGLVQALGAHWDARGKFWYLEPHQSTAAFRPWLAESDERQEYSIESQRAHVAEARTRCWKCHGMIAVICIYCESGLIDGEPYSEFSVAHVTDVDKALRRQLARWPHFHAGYDRLEGRCFIANHCPRCRSLQGDYFLHCEPGGAFFSFKQAPQDFIAFKPLTGRVRLSGEEGFEP
jgi:Domain of unknown function (DUF5710)